MPFLKVFGSRFIGLHKSEIATKTRFTMLGPLFYIIAVGLFPLTLAAAPPAVSITSITYSGTGCPPNSVGQFISSTGDMLAPLILVPYLNISILGHLYFSI
jgi:hypothetical protein